jgi:hypothetical protein
MTTDRHLDSTPAPFDANDAWLAIWAEVATLDEDGCAAIAVQCLHPDGAAGTLAIEGDGIAAVAPFAITGGACEPVHVRFGPAVTERLHRAGSAAVRAVCVYTLGGDGTRRRDTSRVLLVG